MLDGECAGESPGEASAEVGVDAGMESTVGIRCVTLPLGKAVVAMIEV